VNNLKILFAITNLNKGGAERIALDICNELKSRSNVELKLVVFEAQNEYPFLTKDLDIILCNSKISYSILGKDKHEVSRFEAIVNDFKPNVIHTHLQVAEHLARQIPHKEILYISHYHENCLLNILPLSKILSNKKDFVFEYDRRQLLKKYRKCNNHFIAISKDMEEFLFRALPPDLHTIKLLPNAIDFNRFHQKEQKVIEGNELRLVTVGSLVDKKNQVFLVDVMKRLLAHGIHAHLDILGDGENKQKILEEINKAGLNETISVRGKVDKVEEYLHRAHIYVHPALYEPFGLALLEAMAAGLPCVSLDGKGNRDIMIDGMNGYMVETPDAGLFAHRITELWNNRELYGRMSHYAVDFAKKYDIKQYVDRLLAFYNQAIKV